MISWVVDLWMKFKTTAKFIDFVGNFATTLFAEFANFANNSRYICTSANKGLFIGVLLGPVIV